MKVLVADKFPEFGLDAYRALGCEVVSDPDLKEGALAQALGVEQPEVLVVRSTKVQKEHFDAAPGLKLVIRAGAGVNTIDVELATTRGVAVANCPGMNSAAVAELAFAHLLSMDRRIVDGALQLREGRWNKKEFSQARGVKGTTLGIIGLGNIGLEMIPRAKAFGMKVVASCITLTPELARELDIERCENAKAVAERCDVMSVHLALVDATRGLISDEVLAALKPGALFINTSRSGVVDQQALVKHVKTRGIRAALDVFEGEPEGKTGEIDATFFNLPGVQGSHHIGASTEQAQAAVAEEAVRVVKLFLGDGSVTNCVNPAAL
jgi:D-3-phosphoglycerate dehydrogenase